MKKRLRLLTSPTTPMVSFTPLIAALLFTLCGSQAAWGLGLGDIKAESALNEPLVAKIELLNVSTPSGRELIVDVGSKEDYRVAGVERDYFHSDLTLEAFVDGQETPYISVTSTKPVVEPFVNFVVQIRWPQGKLLREYTILLDLPVFTGRSEQQKLKVPKASSRPAQQAPAQQPRPAVAQKTVKTPKPVADVGGEYLVKNGDTLWSLAGSIANDTGSTRQQTMLAIRDGNPNAFISGDPNALKASVVLRMPDQEQAPRSSASDAAVEFANLQKRYARELDATPVLSSNNNFREQQSSDSSSQGRLALTSSAALGAGASAGSEAQGSLAGALVNENEALKEELDRVGLENNDLRERLSALEEQMEVVELLTVQDKDLAAVQEALEDVSEPDDEVIAEEAIAEEVIAEEVIAEEVPAEQIAVESTEDVAVVGAAVASQADTQTPLQAETVQTEQGSEPSLIDNLMGFLPYIGALFVVLLLVVMMVLKRRKAASEDDDGLDDLKSDIPDEDQEVEQEEIEADAEETSGFVGDAEDGMDELFADDDDKFDASSDGAAVEEAAREKEAEAEEIDDVNEEDVEDIDLESALEDIDEFADLDSFFGSDDIADFDPVGDSDDAEDVADAEPAGNKMDFDAGGLELPSETEDEPAEDLHDEEHSMAFDIGDLDLPDDDGLSGLFDDLDGSSDDDLSGGLEDDMADLLADFEDQEGEAGDADLDISGLDTGDEVNQEENLDFDDDLLADFGDEDSEEEINTKLELAEAYVETLDIHGAKELISEILADGNDVQKEAAQKLSARIEGLG